MHTLRRLLPLLLLLATACAQTPSAKVAPADAMSWRWQARLFDFHPDCASARVQYDTPERIERRVRELKAMGVNAIILNGLHPRVILSAHREQILRTDKLICDIAHREGLKVIEHHDLVIAAFQGYNGEGVRTVLKRFDWLSRNVQTDSLIQNFCPSNPEFTKYYLDMLTEYVRETGCDGLMLDEVSYGGGLACGCRFCREQFGRDTGLALPDDESDAFYSRRGKIPYAQLDNLDDPRLVQWFQWRAKTLGDWRARMAQTIRAVRPDFTFLVYTTHWGLTSTGGIRGCGGDLFEELRGCDWIGTEIMSRNMYYCPRAIFFYRRITRAIGEWTGAPIFGLVYHGNNPVAAKAGWALTAMSRDVPWMIAIEGEDMSYAGWADLMDARTARSDADVALLFSVATRNWNRGTFFLDDLGGYSQVLSDAHIQHDILLDTQLAPETLRRYRLIVAPSVSCLSDAQAQMLRDYVRGGGRLLLSGHASLLDEKGLRRKDFALADVMNVNLAEFFGKQLSVRLGADVVPLQYSGMQVTVADPARATVLADYVAADGSSVGPAVVESSYGKGTVLYDGARMGTYEFEEENNPGRKYNYIRNDALHAWLKALCLRAYGGRPAFDATDGIPEKVFVSVFRQGDGDRAPLIVNLLNLTGYGAPEGGVVPSSTPVQPWPALEKDLEFTVALPPVREAYIVSPEFPGRRPVRVTSEGARQRLVIARKDLNWFSTVYVLLDGGGDAG